MLRSEHGSEEGPLNLAQEGEMSSWKALPDPTEGCPEQTEQQR